MWLKVIPISLHSDADWLLYKNNTIENGMNYMYVYQYKNQGERAEEGRKWRQWCQWLEGRGATMTRGGEGACEVPSSRLSFPRFNHGAAIQLCQHLRRFLDQLALNRSTFAVHPSPPVSSPVRRRLSAGSPSLGQNISSPPQYSSTSVGICKKGVGTVW